MMLFIRRISLPVWRIKKCIGYACSMAAFGIMVVVWNSHAVHAAAGEFRCIPYQVDFEIEDQLHLPSDVGVDGQGRLYVLDGTADRVRVYDRHGAPLFVLGDSTLLNQPLGLDVTDDGDVLVADSGNHRLVLFSARGSPPHIIEVPARPGGKPSDPTDVAFTSHSGVYHVVDNENHRIVTIDRHGTVLRTIGEMGRNRQEFRFPFMIDLDSRGNLYIVEVINTRVQVLTPEGDYLRFIGDWGIEPGQFFRPKGIALSNRGEVFISDSYLGVIQVFSQNGDFLGVVSDSEGQVMKFTTPVGLALAGDRLFVIEMYSNRLLVLEKLHP